MATVHTSIVTGEIRSNRVAGNVGSTAVGADGIGGAWRADSTVLQYDSVDVFPEIGMTHALYIAKDENICYRWDIATQEYIPVGGGGSGGGAVESVNGQTGAVVLSAADVGADTAGAASGAVGAHNSDSGAHAALFDAKQDKIVATPYTVMIADGNGKIVSSGSVSNTELNQLDGIKTTETIQSQIDKITGKIPSQASASNQLADKSFVNSSIENVAAYFITKNAAGDPFATKAELNAATVFYSGGVVRVPTRNDYTVVLADESKTVTATGENPTTRYLYNNGWQYQYIVNNSGLTAAQWATVNSGMAAADKTKLDGIEAGAQKNPTSLKNPYKLTLTGAVSATYDGSAAVSVTIPQGGGDSEAHFCKLSTAVAISAQSSTSGGATAVAWTFDEVSGVTAAQSYSNEYFTANTNGSGKFTGITVKKTGVYLISDVIRCDMASGAMSWIANYIWFGSVAGDSIFSPSATTSYGFSNLSAVRLVEANTVISLTGGANMGGSGTWKVSSSLQAQNLTVLYLGSA